MTVLVLACNWDWEIDVQRQTHRQADGKNESEKCSRKSENFLQKRWLQKVERLIKIQEPVNFGQVWCGLLYLRVMPGLKSWKIRLPAVWRNRNYNAIDVYGYRNFRHQCLKVLNCFQKFVPLSFTLRPFFFKLKLQLCKGSSLKLGQSRNRKTFPIYHFSLAFKNLPYKVRVCCALNTTKGWVLSLGLY